MFVALFSLSHISNQSPTLKKNKQTLTHKIYSQYKKRPIVHCTLIKVKNMEKKRDIRSRPKCKYTEVESSSC